MLCCPLAGKHASMIFNSAMEGRGATRIADADDILEG